MARRHHYRKKEGMHDLDLTTFLNLLVVLISFLLVTAVFTRISIQELNVPTASGGSVAEKPLVTIEVMLRKTGVEIGNGTSIIAAIPKVDDKYDLTKLSQFLKNLKDQYPEKTDATLLIEPDIPYEQMIHVMDAIKMQVTQEPGKDTPDKIVLFPDVSVGDAP